MDYRILIFAFLLVATVSGLNIHPVKGHVADYLKSAKWRHTNTYAKIHKPISLDIISNYRLPAGTILYGLGQSRDCEEILKRNSHIRGRDGVYTVYPDKKNPTNVYCDMTTDGGGWTVIQRRFNGHTNFRLNWNDYKRGFGDVNKEYWLGNEKTHTLTSGRNQELRIDMRKFTGSMVYARYSHFSVGSESSKYRLSISGYSGNAGDMMIKAHNLNGMYFTTKDKDNDKTRGYNCAAGAAYHTGGWWYNNCTHSDLNGVYQLSNKRNRKGLFWGQRGENMKTTKMMIRSKK
ncbi:ryncolin-1-like [Ostrea edulis]|uniref:ryncolin-1-like n=1 Tax=Ostrea edulis TaxID=37623 RepID=UPI0024AED0FE|nr:ryncolin-1-like [Ostrea edulis]XP_056023156.1 ryncolin-1-like [Ostrea edulis]XP_056023157.1 ryncolin-1-like [Ostrea edulis]